MPKIKIPSQLRNETNGKEEVEVNGNTVSQAVNDLVQKYPSLKERLYDEQGDLRRYVNIYLGDEDIRFMDYMDTEVQENTELVIVPAIAGGL